MKFEKGLEKRLRLDTTEDLRLDQRGRRFEKGTSRRVRKEFKEVEKGSTLPGR
jgi:hypothetical protein